MLQKVVTAYRKSSARRLISVVYTKASPVARLILWICSIVFVLTAGWMISNPKVSTFIIIASLSCFGVSFEFAAKSAFKSYYKEYSDLIKEYQRNRQFLRYLIFRDFLREDGITPQTALLVRGILFSKDGSIGKQMLRHPFTLILVGFITAILGGAASIHEAWTSGTMQRVVLLIFIALFLNFAILPVFETASNKEKELGQFLQWFAADGKQEG